MDEFERLDVYFTKITGGSNSLRRMAYKVYRRSQSLNGVVAYCYWIKDFCKWLGNSNPDFIINGRYDFVGVVDDYISHLLLERKVAPSTISVAYSAIKKWLETNNIEVDFKGIELPQKRRVEKERLMRKEELMKLINISSLSDKVQITGLLSSGIRIGTFIKLRLKHIKVEVEDNKRNKKLINIFEYFIKSRQI
ncbi:MAG: hypothetical protein J7M38_05595 [Armatimonadetes bacterium]|nr:hypothetical protein [Armatimonadota bacterium]